MNKQDKRLVAYCSLYCPKCYKMTISEAATKLKNELGNPHLCGKTQLLSDSFISNLNKLVEFRCTKICKDGGGNPKCIIRQCCIQKKLNGCWECSNFESCNKLNKQYICNIKRIKEIGLKGYLIERSCKSPD